MNILNKLSLILFALLLTTVIQAQQPDPKYFNEVPPGTTPKIFAPDKVSKESEFEFGAIFSAKGDEFYYGIDLLDRTEIRMIKFENGKWGAPVKVLSHKLYSYNDPMLSPDDSRLFFISNRPITGTGPEKDYDIWYIERQAGKWSEPRNAGKNINTDANEYYISFTKTGKMYFSSNRPDNAGAYNYDVYSSETKNTVFQPAVRLGPNVNTQSYEADVFIAPDESYIIFAANRPEGLGSGDLYVSFRNADGTWTPSKSLGNTINTDTDDFCPYVTADGKYLFYASRKDIYWVSMDVVRDLR